MPYSVEMAPTTNASTLATLDQIRRLLFQTPPQRVRRFWRVTLGVIDPSLTLHTLFLTSCGQFGRRIAITFCMLGAVVVPVHAQQAALLDTPSGQPLPESSFALGAQVPVRTLSALRGGRELVGVANLQKLGGAVSDNTATNIVTGTNSITAGAFANVSGIPIVIQNSGANVLIQNATIINLQLQ